MYYVYILQSLRTGRFYIGQCDQLIQRFHRHQAGHTPSTRNRGPWWMPYYETYATRGEAVRRERELKRKKNAQVIRELIMRSCPVLDLVPPAPRPSRAGTHASNA